MSGIVVGATFEQAQDTGLIGTFFMTGAIALAFLIFHIAGIPAMYSDCLSEVF
ncbi:hypothetical protein D3C76_68220 [compost metagenome]